MAKNVQHFSAFHKWKVNETVKSFIKNETCFGNFINLPKNIEVPRDVLNYLLRLYQNEATAKGGKHFLFDGKKIYCNLEDVRMITGLPINGKEVTGLSSSTLSLKYLGINLCEGKSGRIKLINLRKHFENTDVEGKENFQRYVRAYLLYLFGCILFPDLTGSSVSSHFLSCMEDITMLDSYSWGGAFFAYLMVALDSYACKRSFKGPSLFLVVFFCERIPSLMSIFIRGMENDLPKSVPLLVGWVDNIIKKVNNKHRLVNPELIVTSDHKIIWRPYKRLSSKNMKWIDDDTFKTMFSKTVCICFDKAAPHIPELAWMQYKDEKIRTSTSTCLGKITLKSLAGVPREENWAKTYSKYIGFWQNRHSSYVVEFGGYKPFGEEDEDDDDEQPQQTAPTSSPNQQPQPEAPTSSPNQQLQPAALMYSTRQQLQPAPPAKRHAARSMVHHCTPELQEECACLSPTDLQCLEPGSWLTSPIINFYINYLTNLSRGKNLHIFNTYFYTKLKETMDKNSDYLSKMRQWLRGVDIFEKAFVLLPIHDAMHWSLIIICIPTKQNTSGMIILHLDSLQLHSTNNISDVVSKYLKGEWHRRKNSQEATIWEHFPEIHTYAPVVPQQTNSYDCGVFMLCYIKKFIEVSGGKIKGKIHYQKLVETFGENWFSNLDASSLRVILRDLVDGITALRKQKKKKGEATTPSPARSSAPSSKKITKRPQRDRKPPSRLTMRGDRAYEEKCIRLD